MKNKLFFTLLGALCLIILGTKTQAQDYYYYSETRSVKPLSMGITFSPNIGWLRYGDEKDYSGKTGVGFSYGLLADIGFSRNYYFSTGLNITALNTESNYPKDENNVRSHHKQRIQYIEVPVAVKLKSAENFNRVFYGKFGLTVGAKISGREKINGSENRTTIPNANVLRMGLQIGGGAEWNLDYNLRLLTGLTFNNGFTRTMKAGEPKNSYVSLDFGFLF